MLYTFTDANAGDGFGIGIADAGDINKDGNDDLAICVRSTFRREDIYLLG
jgi:hypothetical protein